MAFLFILHDERSEMMAILRTAIDINEPINILGSEYSIVTNPDFIEHDGECEFYSRSIELRPCEKMLEDATVEAKRKRYREVARHEIIHAFLFESGLDEYARNEQLVDWIAMQFPKLNKVFSELEILE